MKIVRDDFEIERLRAWADEELHGYDDSALPYDDGYTEGYAQAIANFYDWLIGETNQSPDS